jgi:hypothetical protein
LDQSAIQDDEDLPLAGFFDLLNQPPFQVQDGFGQLFQLLYYFHVFLSWLLVNEAKALRSA